MSSHMHHQFIYAQPQNLSSEYQYVDMHCHSTHSDGKATVDELLKKAKELGVGLAITDHNTIQGVLEAAQDPTVFLIPGIEISGKEGIHILLYFYSLQDLQDYYTQHVEPYKIKESFYILKTPTISLVNAAKKYKCVMSIAHPFGAGATGLCQPIHDENIINYAIQESDAVEIFNAGILSSQNQQAMSFCRVSNAAVTAGSDAHSLSEFGGALTFTKSKGSVAEFLDAVKLKHSFGIGKEYPVSKLPLAKTKTMMNFVTHPYLYGRHGLVTLGKSLKSKVKAKNTIKQQIKAE